MYSFILSLTSALDGGGLSTPRPCRFSPRINPVPIVWEAGLAPGPGRTFAENLTPPGFDSLAVQCVAYLFTYYAVLAHEVHGV
jgi:hypothetical protein